MKTKIRYSWPLFGLLVFAACQKEVSDSHPSVDNVTTPVSGVVPDDPERVANIALVRSANFTLEQSVSSDGKLQPGTSNKPSRRDKDGDGISDSNDACPTEKEVVNGYLDEDGCPDEAPPPPAPVPADIDGDGILDVNDSCPNDPENFNGFQDTDGCPDTPVVVLPPSSIPASYTLATPAIRHQGNEGTCAPFAVAYAARSIDYYYRTNAASYSDNVNVFSPEYVYNQIKIGECGSGSSVVTALDLLVTQGVCTWQAMPYDDRNGCTILPNVDQSANASAYKIASYVKVANSDEVAIKTMIASNRPVIANILADNSFVNARAGFVWTTYSGSGALPHSLVICGYDDSKHAYKVMNSWGVTWGDAGYGWIDYDLFPQKSSYYNYVIQ